MVIMDPYTPTNMAVKTLWTTFLMDQIWILFSMFLRALKEAM